ncbi:hypothetical protein [Nocardia implantans]|uniref:Uncharacterized protein n=1 Tax=Nocardia implantans TaxID=3108168 RepID=A0ABU6APY8_9NOCA|nr:MULTISPECIES: hypothetical protein [unclassified Nocardia]MBF6189788.1 hypothetical protein [Nocardia beijingensis]MEA3526981.1 hypothetical protein [Nocardia sp. CDC192]MEB3509441.1 hypothetical protein [Nocardia sp. CDC186]
MATTATETEAKKTTTTSKGKHFWVVKLYCPPGASEGLRAYIAMAETAIQTAVDLLGRGMTTLPPAVSDLLEPEIYETLGSGKADDEYRATVNKVEARQLQLLQMDDKVIKTSATVAAEQVQALRSIENIVEDLNTTLKAVGTGKLKSAQELSLLKAVAQAVDAVYDKVIAIAELNEQMANGGGSGNSGSGGSNGSGSGGAAGGTGGAAGSGGGGDGGLSSLLSSLAMLPMMALPLVQQIPQMLQNAEEQKQKKAEEDRKNGQPQPGQPGQTQPPGTQAAPAAAPQPGDPNAQPAAVETATAQPGGITAAPAANTAPPPEPDGTSTAGTTPSVVQARRTRDVSAADRPANGSTQDATTDEQPDQDAGAVIEV